ncbi:hypothetical protein L3X38_029164 [Prunus dulcis]|uniref:Uncharacterized protein n=1 Tax=Prunus dulcis TaxID=3755 RepID=A0AAD4Z136_PRUDU|nr:hypothetical protein L3X38_029164 [Prunus dulcis]
MLLLVLVFSEEMLVKSDGGVVVAMMFRRTSMRKGWPRARKLVPCRVIGSGEVSSTRSRAFLYKGCRLVSDIKEDPLRPGVLMATVEDRLCNAGGLGIWKDGFLSGLRFKVSYIFEDLRTMHLSNKFRCCMLAEVIDDLKKKIGFRGLIVGIVNGATDIYRTVQRARMEKYGCHVTLGLSLLTHDLTHEAIREVFIAALELREKRTVGQSTERVHAIEFVKGMRTTQSDW